MSDRAARINISQLAETSPPADPDVSTDNSFRFESPSGSRQKRRRTSPRDHAILESAYQRNSKPDKDERTALVNQTELGEKEVQIWFQNRRQNDRRKAKPLAPYELIPHFRNGIPHEATQPYISQLPSPINSQEPIYVSDARPYATPQNTSPKQDIQSILNPADSGSNAGHGTSTGPYNLTPPPTAPGTQPNASQPDQVVRKRSHEQMKEGEKPHTDEIQASKQIRRTSSFLRIALSQDGSANIRREGETTPSPPKERPAPPQNAARRRSSLTRAHSDVSFQFRDTAMKGPPGRSRDARTWEFYCDKSARSSLASRAEEEATGSAVGAIGLVRSASGRRMQPLASNSTRQTKNRKLPAGGMGKPPLSRAHSSMARLQSSDGTAEDELRKQRPGHGRRSSGSDSDKENWIPGTNEVGVVQPRPANGTRRPVLQPPSSTSSTHGVHSTTQTTNGKAKAKVDDLDCIQGLLSLSQGAWK